MADFKVDLDNFLTPENIEYVQTTGNVKSEIFTVRFGDVDFREKDFIGLNITRETIFNSVFNRDLNLHNDEVLADKLRYCLEIMAGCAKIGILPVSFIHDLPQRMHRLVAHLHLKDRGHTTYMLSHLDYKAPLAVWRKVVRKLEETNCRNSEILIDVKETINQHIQLGSVPEFSLTDVTTKDMRDGLNNTTVAMEVSIESLENHRVEIINLNNSGNAWSVHMYGQIILQTLLTKDITPALDLDDLYKTVKNLDVFLAKRPFLSGTKSTIRKHSGHEDEMLMFYKGCVLLQEAKNIHNKDIRYKYFEKTDDEELRQEMFRLIYEKKVKTNDMKNLARMWQAVADVSQWSVFENHMVTIKEQIVKLGYPGSVKNLVDIIPTAPRAALRWFDMINDLKRELNWGSDIRELTQIVIEHAITLTTPPDDDPMDNDTIRNLKEATTSRASRETYFYSILHKRIVNVHKNSKSARASKERKLLHLRAHLTKHNFNQTVFDVIDRRREGSYTITTIDLNTGRGLELGHKKAGVQFTDENTFLQFPNDNKFNSAHHITEGYWIEYGGWVQEMQERVGDVDVDAFANTLLFCEIMEDSLI